MHSAWHGGVSTHAGSLPPSQLCVLSGHYVPFPQLLKTPEEVLLCSPGPAPVGFGKSGRCATGKGEKTLDARACANECALVGVRARLCANECVHECVRVLGQAVDTQHPPRPQPTQSCCSRGRAILSGPGTAGRRGCEGPAGH